MLRLEGWPTPFSLLGLGALFVLFTYCFVWPITKTLVNGACSPRLETRATSKVHKHSKIYVDKISTKLEMAVCVV